MKSSENILAIFGICLGCTTIALVFTMVNTAIPSIQTSLGLPLNSLQWMMTVFGLINCSLLVTCGRFADIFGRKRVFLIGMLSSALGMVLGGFSESTLMLVVSMGFAGLGNAILLPVSQAMLVVEFPEYKRGKAIALWASSIAFSLALGPVIGGMITSVFGWRWVFWVNAPIILFGILLVVRFAKESRNEVDSPQLDLKGVVLLTISVISLVLVMTEHSHLSGFVLLTFTLIGMASLYLLSKHEKTVPYPIMSNLLWKNRTFLCASMASFSLVFIIWSLFFLIPLYLQKQLNLSPLFSGLIMLGIPLPSALLSTLLGKYYRAERAWVFTLLGFGVSSLSALVFMSFSPTIELWVVFLSFVCFGFAYCLIWGPTATAAVSCFPRHQSGIASGTFVTIQELGGTFGLAMVVTHFESYSTVDEGFKSSMIILFLVGLLGCVFGSLMKPQKKEKFSIHQ